MAKQDIRDLVYDKKLLENNLADALRIAEGYRKALVAINAICDTSLNTNRQIKIIAEDAIKNAEIDEAIWTMI